MKIKTLGLLSFILAATSVITIFFQLSLNGGTNYQVVIGSFLVIACTPLSVSVLLKRIINRDSVDAQVNMSYLKLGMASAVIGTITLYTLGYLGVVGYLFWILGTIFGLLSVFVKKSD